MQRWKQSPYIIGQADCLAVSGRMFRLQERSPQWRDFRPTHTYLAWISRQSKFSRALIRKQKNNKACSLYQPMQDQPNKGKAIDTNRQNYMFLYIIVAIVLVAALIILFKSSIFEISDFMIRIAEINLHGIGS